LIKVRLALYQPEIPQNLGSILRVCTCFDLFIDVIDPCGFAFSSRRLKRSGMDYMLYSRVKRYEDCATFIRVSIFLGRRLVGVDAEGFFSLENFRFKDGDTLVMGSESSGLPYRLKKVLQSSVYIPMCGGSRSLNLAVSTSIVLSLALYKLNKFP
jgi:tRNA (cytidine/uridine-2'-O-)-methyltransferase